MADAKDTQVAGVTLAQFAFVRAGLADGLRVDELLGFHRLDALTWEAAEQAWDERVLDAMEHGELALLNAIDEATEDARANWSRRIPPLDEDLRGWFDFLQAWQDDVDPPAFLRRMGLGVAELAHLHRLWSRRLMQDTKLRAEALVLLGEQRREAPVPAPEPPRLIRPPRATPTGNDVTADIPPGKGRTLPFAEGEPAPLPPPLAVPLPRRRRPRTTAPGVDETRLDGAAQPEGPLPFVAGGDGVADPPAEVADVVVGAPSPAVESAHELAVEPSAPIAAPPRPEVAHVAPRILEPTLILPATQAMLAPAASPGLAAAQDLDQTTAIRRETGAVVPFTEAFRDAEPEEGQES